MLFISVIRGRWIIDQSDFVPGALTVLLGISWKVFLRVLWNQCGLSDPRCVNHTRRVDCSACLLRKRV